MPVTYVYTENTIAEWRTYFNIMGANVGDLDRLEVPYPGNADLVSAINTVYFAALVPSGLLTNNTTSIVGAINEIWANVGPLPELVTTTKGNLVYAINEVYNKNTFDGNVTIQGNLQVDYGIRAEGNIDGYSDFNLAGNARIGANLYVDGTAHLNDTLIAGNLYANGEYIFLNSNNIYMMDPVLRIGTALDGGDYPGDDQRDRGISFGYFDNNLPSSGFFGFDRGKKEYYFLNDVFETDGYLITGNLANVNADYYFVSGKVLPNTIPSNGQVLVDIGEFYNRFSNIYGNNLVTGNANIEFDANIYGDLVVGNIILPATTLNVDIGSANLRFANIYAYGMNVIQLDLDLSGAYQLVDDLIANADLGNSLTTPGGPLDSGNIANLLAWQDLYLDDLYANTLTVANVANLAKAVFSVDSLIELNSNIGNVDSYDIGFYGKTPNVVNGNVIIGYSGLFRDASETDKRFKFFKFLNTWPEANVIDTSDPQFKLANVQAEYFIGDLDGYAEWAKHIYASNVIEDGDTANGNVFFTNTRTRLAVSNTGVGLNYNKVAGIFNLDLAAIGVSVLPASNTDQLPEGLSNLYYSNDRAQVWFESYFSATTPLAFSNGVINLTALTTDDVPEGTTNFYYTDARARAALSTGDSIIVYDPGSGVITANLEVLGGVSSVNGQTGDVVLTSDDVDEGTINLYFTEERWDEYVSLLTTDAVTEGNTNFYFSNARALAALHPDGTLDYDTNTGNLSVNVAGICNLVVTSVNGVSGNVTLFTANIFESGNTTSGNVYFSNARARQAFTFNGAITYDQANGVVTVPGPYGLDFKTFVFTLGAPTSVVSGSDDFGKILDISMASAVDVFVNGVRAIANVDYIVYNTLATSNVTFTSTVPAGTEISIREITGNIAVSQGYITQNVTDYVETLVTLPTSGSVNLDLNYGQNTNFYVNISQVTTITWSNPPVSANKVFVFTIFLNFGAGNEGNWDITWPASVRWDDNSPPIFTAIPDRLEAVTFFTINSGTLFYGYKNLSNAPNS